ncbi:uncharacterized protein BDR25DRAFT_313338 [Lindgomyces ingoldianus]|uniref:Uncharacterized protein n=1 Tax=Lindgomyces ingoldianus TaxID=673940 RepID=A0ACB6R1E9_9PLEO|nr:uncharacterized protein BDR25DRAFT_313338 [Lindgomyces ingoldianus]KAF2472162.1 hypothetical protein BDR25DRAFT_313338 [Lindgomyces ingoldianus]
MSVEHDRNGPLRGRSGPPARKPNRTVNVPIEYQPSMSWPDLERISKVLSVESGCEVVPRMENRQPTKFEIFGQGLQLEAAVKVVNRWIENAPSKTPASSSWPKTSAFHANKWYYDTVKQMDMERKEKFKGEPPEEAGLIRVVVDWPDELRRDGIDPASAFGNGLVALNPIRMDDEVYISFCPHRGPVLQVEIQGYEEAHVASALEHYENLVQKVQTIRSLSVLAINIVLDKGEGTEVVLRKIPSWWPVKIYNIYPQLLPAVPPVAPKQGNQETKGEFRKKSLDPSHLVEIQKQITQVLECIRFERGYYDLTVRYGCLGLVGMADEEIGKTYKLPVFETSICGTRVTCLVTKWAGDQEFGERLLARLMAAGDILVPAKIGGPSKLSETRPTFQGTWMLQDPNSTRPVHPNARDQRTASQPKTIVVQIDWTEDEEGMFEKMPLRFYHVKEGKIAPKEHLDINLMELGEGKAWHIGLESMVVVPKSKLSPVVVNFADGVRMRSGDAANLHSKESFAQWSTTPSTRLKGCRLDRVYTFRIRDTNYHVEARQMWYPCQTAPCWGVVVRHSEWSTHLNPLETLVSGRIVQFGDTAKTFFPGDGGTSAAPAESSNDMPQIQNLDVEEREPDVTGITLLVKALMRLSVVINDCKAPPN